MTICKHNKLTNQTVTFPNLDAVGEEYTQANGWEDATQEQIDDVNLQITKEAKLLELQTIYSSPSTWQCTLKAVDGSLTRDKNWLRDNITLTSRFKDDEGVPFVKNFTAEQILKIRDDLQYFGSLMFYKKEEIQSKINSAQKISDIEQIDIENEFEKINKIIEIA